MQASDLREQLATRYEQNPRLFKLAAVAVVLLLIVLVMQVFSGPPSEAELVEQLNNGAGANERVEAMRKLGSPESEQAIEAVGKYASDSNTKVAREALFTLGRSRSKAAVEHVDKALKDKRPEVRAAAVGALGKLGRENVDEEKVAKMLKPEEEPAVRQAAAKSIGRLQAWEGMPALVQALRDSDVNVRRRASLAIRRILGVDYGYRADDPPKKRQKAIQRIQQHWRDFKKAHEEYLKRKGLE